VTTFSEYLRSYREALAGDFIPAIEAARLVDQMAAEHPAALDEWMRAHAVQHAAAELTALLRSERATTRRHATTRAFSEAVASGDPEALSVFREVHVIDNKATRRSVGDMTGADHRYVAGQYAHTGRRALTLEAFHLAVAKKVGTRRTAEVFSEATYVDMLRSLTGADTAA
jgi:hypothetical protein